MRRRRKKSGYFEALADAPSPIVVRVERRVALSEADVMGIAWHGRYASYFEAAWSELARRCDMSFQSFADAKLQAPIVQLHVDYHRPLRLDECFTVEARGIWCEGARMNTEYVVESSTGEVAATGYTVQMFIHAETGRPCLVSPPLLEACRTRWRAGELSTAT